MRKNLERYYQAWELRKRGKKLREIGQITGITVERARILANHIDLN